MSKKDLKDLGLDSKIKNENAAVVIHEFLQLGWVDPFKLEAAKGAKSGQKAQSSRALKETQAKDLNYLDNMQDQEII